MNSADFEKRKSKNKIQTFIDKKNSVHTALTIKVWILFWFGYLKKSKRLDFLRHTYCSNMAKAGMNPKVLQYLMGHSDIGVTLNTYTHLKLDDAKEEMEKLAKKQAKADDELRQMGKKSDGIRIRKFG